MRRTGLDHEEIEAVIADADTFEVYETREPITAVLTDHGFGLAVRAREKAASA